jgi:hypothetical protein
VRLGRRRRHALKGTGVNQVQIRKNRCTLSPQLTFTDITLPTASPHHAKCRTSDRVIERIVVMEKTCGGRSVKCELVPGRRSQSGGQQLWFGWCCCDLMKRGIIFLIRRKVKSISVQSIDRVTDCLHRSNLRNFCHVTPLAPSILTHTRALS